MRVIVADARQRKNPVQCTYSRTAETCDTREQGPCAVHCAVVLLLLVLFWGFGFVFGFGFLLFHDDGLLLPCPPRLRMAPVSLMEAAIVAESIKNSNKCVV